MGYLCRPANVQKKSVYEYFNDEYMEKAPLVGQAFTTDEVEVHIYIVSFTSENMFAEANMVACAAENNGYIDNIALKDHYKGVGVHAVNAVQADKVLNDLFHSGENKAHMWWYELERQLTHEFNTCDCLEKSNVQSNDMILRILSRKILADLLQATKASLNL